MESLLTIGLDQRRFIIHYTEFLLLLLSLSNRKKLYLLFRTFLFICVLYSIILYRIDQEKKLKTLKRKLKTFKNFIRKSDYC